MRTRCYGRTLSSWCQEPTQTQSAGNVTWLVGERRELRVIKMSVWPAARSTTTVHAPPPHPPRPGPTAPAPDPCPDLVKPQPLQPARRRVARRWPMAERGTSSLCPVEHLIPYTQTQIKAIILSTKRRHLPQTSRRMAHWNKMQTHRRPCAPLPTAEKNEPASRSLARAPVSPSSDLLTEELWVSSSFTRSSAVLPLVPCCCGCQAVRCRRRAALLPRRASPRDWSCMPLPRLPCERNVRVPRPHPPPRVMRV